MLPLRDNVPSSTFPVVNWLLIAANVLAFLYEISLGEGAQEFVQQFGVVPIYFLNAFNIHEAITLFTSMFLHGGWAHLFSNMLALFIFGDNLEDRMGPAGYLVFYLVCGVAAGMTHVFLNPYSQVPTIGASGAIAGVLGGYLLLFPRATVLTLVPVFYIPWLIEIPALFYLGFWFLSQLLNGTLAIVTTAQTGGTVAWWAHAGGFAAGLALVYPFTGFRRTRHYYA